MALACQQVDGSCEELWFQLLERSQMEGWKPATRTLILDAWRGLLWRPSAAAKAGASEIICFPRLLHGLQSVAQAISGRQDEQGM